MREIKFRAWHKQRKEMFAPSAILNPTETEITVVEGGEYRMDKFRLGEYVLMQFTGLKDKNGKEIYEGDIINVANRQIVNEPVERTTYEVYWNGEWGGWQGRYSNYHSNEMWGTSRWIDIEILGSIYENPELLK